MKRQAIQALTEWKDHKTRKPLILRGARQVGKTHLLKEFGHSEFPEMVYVNFEEDEGVSRIFERDLKPGRIINELQLYLDCSIDIHQDLLIFDEIQRCPRALTSLKYFCEESPELALCAAGSLLGVCLNEASFPVGKVTYLDLAPMTFDEFVEALGKTRLLDQLNTPLKDAALPELAHEQLWDLWKHYLVVGGLPEAVKTYCEYHDNLRHAFQQVRQIQGDLIDTYLVDIAKHCGKMNALHVERLWRAVPAQLARSQDGSARKFVFKDAVPGIRGYERLSGLLGWLEQANLLIRTSIIDTPSLPLAAYARENIFKLYFFDVGLLGAISGMSPALLLDYEFGSYKGYVAENFVAQAIDAAGIRRHYCWQGRTSEVEFLLSTDQGIIPIEVKSGTVTQSKSLKVYEQKYDPSYSCVISGKNIDKHGKRLLFPLYMAGRIPTLLNA